MRYLAVLALLVSTPAFAADHALVLSDQEMQQLVNVLDIATKAQGLSAAAITLHLFQKLQAAPLVTGEHTDKPAASKDAKP